jgi:hypothetical protein
VPDRKLEAREDYAHNRWQFVMTQRLRLKYLEDQKIGAEGWVTNEAYHSIGEEEIRRVIEHNLNDELDRFADAVYAYDEAYGDTEPPY